MALALAVAPVATAGAVAYDPPLTITRGGVYTGNWASTTPDVPAVWVRTTEPVTIVDSRLKGPGTLVFAGRGANVTVTGSFGYGSVLPGNPAYKYFVDGQGATALRLENNHVQGLPLVRILGVRLTPATAITIRYNRGRDIQGTFVQFNTARNLPGATIAWNEVINRPGTPVVIEDVFSAYASTGKAGTPIDFGNNFVFGTYASLTPTVVVSTGTAFNGGDQAVGSRVKSGHVRIHHNQVARTGSAGPGAPGGNNIEIDHNRSVSSGRLPTGAWVNNDYSKGISVWNYYVTGQRFANVWAHDNVSGFVASTGGDGRDARREDFFVPDCSVARGVSRCVNNVALPGPITSAMEFAEYGLWLAKVRDAGVTIGPSIAGDPAYGALYTPTE